MRAYVKNMPGWLFWACLPLHIAMNMAAITLFALRGNSGVLHSGIYYDSSTLKAKVCAEGARRMKAFATEYGINYQHSGKVIVATSQQDLPVIDRLLKNAQENGIRAERLDEQGVRRIEPHAGVYQQGIHCPDTAVIDSKAVLSKLRELLTWILHKQGE